MRGFIIIRRVKRTVLAFFLVAGINQCGHCAAGWTPLKLQLYKNAAFPASDTVIGVSLGLAGYTEDIYGIQAGFYNSAVNVRGLQIGLVNVCRNTLRGVQLGFANIGGKNAVLPVTIGLNIGF